MVSITQINKFDEIIDVRSASEYEEDHIPGSTNYPILSNNQRSLVGKLYKDDFFEANKQGAVFIMQNATYFIDKYFKHNNKNWKPLIYCWRGGKRSQTIQYIFNQIGWQAQILEGGYKAYRNWVIHTIESLANKITFFVINGKTGCGKTKLLQSLEKQGNQIIDLEYLANHRGSFFGKQGNQPSQKKFESLLCAQLKLIDISKPIFIESESRKIGKIYIPDAILKNMRSSFSFVINVNINQRINFLIQEYQEFIQNPDKFTQIVSRLTPYTTKYQLDLWLQLHQKKDFKQLVVSLLTNFYDIGYSKSLDKNYKDDSKYHVTLKNIEENSLNELAKQIMIKSNNKGL